MTDYEQRLQAITERGKIIDDIYKDFKALTERTDLPYSASAAATKLAAIYHEQQREGYPTTLKSVLNMLKEKGYYA